MESGLTESDQLLLDTQKALPFLRRLVPKDGEWWDIHIRARRLGENIDVSYAEAIRGSEVRKCI